jgi:2,4-dienoyl-CoA reductase-like NADH-dependent reductase (Old Yellow Enzyme family)
MNSEVAALFEPFMIKSVTLPTRIVMSAMTRMFSPEGVPGEDVAAYYRRRAEADVGLIVTEGIGVDHRAAVDRPGIPVLHGDAPLAGWKRVVDEVHSAGGRIFPQLWHMGVLRNAKISRHPDYPNAQPSGTIGTVGKNSLQPELLRELMVPGAPLTEREVEDLVAAFAQAARSAKAAGFDGMALHGGHGYLIDNFLWRETNKRTDRYGGDHVGRTRFAVEIIRAVRREIGPDMPIMFRFSQHKQQDYDNNLARNPRELEEILTPMADAGVDLFDASQRRVERATFEGSDLNLAGWAKKLTGKPTMTIGGIGLHFDVPEHASNRTAIAAASVHNNLPEVMRRFRRGDFDLVGSGRSLLSDPGWARRIRNGDPILPFDRTCESRLT